MKKLNVKSPIGELTLVGNASVLVGLYFPGSEAAPPDAELGKTPLLERVARQLDEYFGGERRTFDVELAGQGTPFQQLVWDVLREIPYGALRSYGDVARRIGRPAASRAVGAANGRNPISIIVPCHRVIGSTGQLTGYGGGLPAKRWLLAHEERYASTQQRMFA